MIDRVYAARQIVYSNSLLRAAVTEVKRCASVVDGSAFAGSALDDNINVIEFTRPLDFIQDCRRMQQ